MPERGLAKIVDVVSISVSQTRVEVSLEKLAEDATKLLKNRTDINKSDIDAISDLVVQFNEGKLTLPTPQEFLASGRYEYRLAIAKRTLEGIIVTSIVPRTEAIGTTSLKMRLGREINQLEFFLGQSRGEEFVIAALKEMPTAQRALLCESMSTAMKEKLEYPDLYECDERQLANYLKYSTRGRPKQQDKKDKVAQEIVYGPTVEQMDKLATVLEAVLERSDDGEIDNDEVLKILVEEPDVLEKMIRIAQIGGFLDDLFRFLQNPETLLYARRCFRLLHQGDYRDVDEEERLE